MMDDTIALDSIQAIAASFGSSFDAEKIMDTVVEKDGTRYYKVRWIKYSWEPSASFTHLEHLIAEFWDQLTQNTQDKVNVEQQEQLLQQPLGQFQHNQPSPQQEASQHSQNPHQHKTIPQTMQEQHLQEQQHQWELQQPQSQQQQQALLVEQQQQHQQQSQQQDQPQPSTQQSQAQLKQQHDPKSQQQQQPGQEKHDQHQQKHKRQQKWEPVQQQQVQHQGLSQQQQLQQGEHQLQQQHLAQPQSQQLLEGQTLTQEQHQTQGQEHNEELEKQQNVQMEQSVEHLEQLLSLRLQNNGKHGDSSQMVDTELISSSTFQTENSTTVSNILPDEQDKRKLVRLPMPLDKKGEVSHDVGQSSKIDEADGSSVKPKTRRKIPGTCPICGKHFKSTTNIAAHRKLHTEERKHTCDKCGQKFRRKLHLDRHLQSHNNVKSYSCEVCGNSFSSKWYMLAHARIHSGEKPFSCDRCDKKFADKANLNKHKLIHVNTKPYICNECGHAYRQSYDLKRHMAVHLTTKNFTCDTCGKTFARKSYLQRHAVAHSHSTNPQDLTEEINDNWNEFKSTSSVLQKDSSHVKPNVHGKCETFSCRFCALSFLEQKQVVEHMKTKHHTDACNKPDSVQLQGDDFVVVESSGRVHTMNLSKNQETNDTLKEMGQPNEANEFIGPDGRPVYFLTLHDVNDGNVHGSALPTIGIQPANQFEFM